MSSKSSQASDLHKLNPSISCALQLSIWEVVSSKRVNEKISAEIVEGSTGWLNSQLRISHRPEKRRSNKHNKFQRTCKKTKKQKQKHDNNNSHLDFRANNTLLLLPLFLRKEHHRQFQNQSDNISTSGYKNRELPMLDEITKHPEFRDSQP